VEKTWAKGTGPAEIGGVDLHLDLSGTRVRAGLENALRGAVRAGHLRPGTRLPSSRALAADLGIARNTVAEVYSQLVAEGWLTARTGAGTSVAPRRVPEPGAGAAPRPEPAMARYDLRAGVPDLSAFPRRAWLATARRVLAAAPDRLLGYPDPRGVPQLRAALAEYLARARGVTADPAHIVICAGFAHGLAGIARALRSAGARTLAVEAYGHQAHRDIAAGQGLRLRPLPVDGMGAVVAETAGADAALLTPAHQFPLGVTLHPRRRREAADWGGVVIEDDYDGEFRYDRQPVGALQTLAPDRVIYAGTASKSLAPSLRLGWLVVPPWLLDAITAEMAAGPSALDQLTLAEFITSGGYDRQIRRARLTYRHRRDRLAAALSRQGLRVTGIAAGLHAVLEFSRTELEHAVVARASQHGLAIDGLGRYRAGPAHFRRAPEMGPQHGPETGSAGDTRAGLVIGYGRPPEHAYTTALARLCAVLPGQDRTGVAPPAVVPKCGVLSRVCRGMVMDAGFEVVRSRLLVAAGAFGTESVTFWAIMPPEGPAVDRSGSLEFDAALVRLLAEIGRRHTQLAAAIAGHGCRLREARNGYRTAEQTVGAMIDQMMDPDVPG
jgi:GntR family transcriptional regulator / MocR family aminotransferase